VRARADYRRLERGLTDRLRALPQYAPIAARALDAERLLAEGRYDDSRGPGAGTEFTQAKAQLETLLVLQESTEERRQRLTQDETTVATQETRITALEQERVEAQTRLEKFQSLLTRAESERSSLEAAKQALADEVSALQGRLEQAKTDLQTAATEKKDLSRTGDQLRQDLTQKQARIQELEARIQKTDAELAAARTSESKAVERSRQVDLELAAARQEIGTLRTQLTAAGSEPRSGGASAAAAAGGTAAAEAGATDLAQPARGRSHVNSIGMRLLGVDAGTFEMGSPSNESGRDSDEQRHSVRLTQAFWMAETEVTQGQWLAVMQAEPRGGFHSANKGAEVAANTLSWTEAMDFCRRLTEQEQRAGRLPQGFAYTLPTEAQWEYACRAGTRTPFSFGGDERQLGQYAVYSGSRDGLYAHRVKSRKPNPWGFYDMHGNVWEWCLDSWGGGDDTYRDGITDPLAQGGPQRVGRGGSWNNSPAGCRSADRNASDPSGACANLGFRPVLAPRSGGRPSSARRQLDEGKGSGR
jgi:formylglycine-generating enzyme required for sulfatase activity